MASGLKPNKFDLIDGVRWAKAAALADLKLDDNARALKGVDRWGAAINGVNISDGSGSPLTLHDIEKLLGPIGPTDPTDPTDPSAGTTWNPDDKDASIDLSNGDLTATGRNEGKNLVRTIAQITTKTYVEYDIVKCSKSNRLLIGPAMTVVRAGGDLGDYGSGWLDNGDIWQPGGNWAGGVNALNAGDRACIAIDPFAKLQWNRVRSGPWNSNDAADPATGVGGISISSLTFPLYLGATVQTDNDSVTGCFAAASWLYTPPAGYIGINASA